MLPIQLKNLLGCLLKDNTLVNFRILGSDHTILSLKFENQSNPHAAAGAAKHERSPISYRPKSPSTIGRDMRRLADWKNGSLFCDDSITNVDMLDSGISTTIPLDTYENTANCPENKSGNTSHVNSTMITVTEHDNALHVVNANASIMQNECSTQTCLAYKPAQTEPPVVQDAVCQTEPGKNRRSQTTQREIHKFNKCLQTVSTATDNTSQTILNKPKMRSRTTNTSQECFQPDKATMTDPTENKHVQTYASKTKARSVQANDLHHQTTQTESRKCMKTKEPLPEPLPPHEPCLEVQTTSKNDDFANLSVTESFDKLKKTIDEWKHCLDDRKGLMSATGVITRPK